MRWLYGLLILFLCNPLFGQYGYDQGYYGGYNNGIFGGFFRGLFGGVNNEPYPYYNDWGYTVDPHSNSNVPPTVSDVHSVESVPNAVPNVEEDNEIPVLVDDGEVDMEVIKGYEGIVLPPPPTKIPRFYNYWY